jgi:two-component system response regulator DevR
MITETQMISVTADPAPQYTELPQSRAAQTRLLVVDDHAAIRAGLRDLLEDEDDFEVVAAVASAQAAMSVAKREPIDVAVVDYQLAGRNGLWVSRKLKRLPSPPAVLIYSAYADGVLAAAAVVAEADAIVSKGELGSELCNQIRRVARGLSSLRPMPTWLGDTIRSRFGHEEQAIFGLLLAGVDPSEIAETLGRSEAVLESRLWAMLRKLEAPHSEHRFVDVVGDAA